MPAKKRPEKKRRPKRPYQVTAMRHAKRRHRGSKRHHGRMMQEAKTMRVILEHMLRKQHGGPEEHYHPRHFSKDPEYAFSDARTQRFKRSVPSPDVHYWRPQGPGASPHQQNFPNVVPRRQHPHAWRFEQRV